MYGLVNAALQELVCTQFGEETWAEVKRAAGVDIERFTRTEQYSDDITFKLVEAASKKISMTLDEMWESLGKFLWLYLGREGYGHLMDPQKQSVRDFLLNLHTIYDRVKQDFTKLSAPSFRVEDVDNRTLRLHYLSNRRGLCPMVLGILRELGRHFEAEVLVDHPVCSRDGADHCEFILHIN